MDERSLSAPEQPSHLRLETFHVEQLHLRRPEPGYTSHQASGPASGEQLQQLDALHLRDAQREVDVMDAFTWAHTFNASTVLNVSPFYHYNSANYDPNPNDYPIATTSDRATNYGGAEANITTTV